MKVTNCWSSCTAGQFLRSLPGFLTIRDWLGCQIGLGRWDFWSTQDLHRARLLSAGSGVSKLLLHGAAFYCTRTRARNRPKLCLTFEGAGLVVRVCPDKSGAAFQPCTLVSLWTSWLVVSCGSRPCYSCQPLWLVELLLNPGWWREAWLFVCADPIFALCFIVWLAGSWPRRCRKVSWTSLNDLQRTLRHSAHRSSSWSWLVSWPTRMYRFEKRFLQRTQGFQSKHYLCTAKRL